MINKKTVIGVVCSPWLGGSGVVGAELANYLATFVDDFEVVFIGFEYPFRLDQETVSFFKVESVKHSLFSNPLDEVALTEGIVQAVIQHKIEILHAHFAIPFGYCAIQAREILARMKIPVKVVTTLHGTDVLHLGKSSPEVMKYIINQSDVLTAVSHDLATQARTIYSTRRLIKVIYNFIDFESIPTFLSKRRSSLRRKYAKKDELLFLHISNFRAIKRITDTLEVFFKVNKKIPAKMILIGEGPELNVARKRSISKRKNALLSFIGKVKDPFHYLAIADGLIITSEYESFCLVGLEAMAVGVPVFGTRVGGIPEVVQDGKSGYLVPVGEMEQLSQRIVGHFSDAEKVDTMRKQSQKLSGKFDAKKIIPQYINLYRSLMPEKKRSVSVKASDRLHSLAVEDQL